MRDLSFDICKGLLIMCVVIGHLMDGLLHDIIFLFHMPCFFMITGMLTNWECYWSEFVKKRFKSYCIPYFAWSILFYFCFFIENPIKYVLRVIYGGAMNTTAFTYPFWFICCLFISSLCLCFLYKWKKYVVYFMVLFLLLWYTNLNQIDIISLPWSIEVVPFALLYFLLGKLVRKIELYSNWLRIIMYSISLVMCCVIIILRVNDFFDYTINMKSASFSNLIVDILFPIVFYFGLKFLSNGLLRIRYVKDVFICVGKSSLVIFFTHASIFVVCKKYLDFDILKCEFMLFFISIVLGCFLYMCLKKNIITSKLLLGK